MKLASKVSIRGLHHCKSRAEAVKNIPSVNSKTGGKVLFQNSIQKSMGIRITTAFLLYTRPNFSHAPNPIKPRESLCTADVSKVALFHLGLREDSFFQFSIRFC